MTLSSLAASVLALLVVVPTTPADTPPHVLPQPSIEERDDDGGIAFVEVDCVVYETRVMKPPLIDWKCAEEAANMDGGNDLAKNFAIALLAVRDHRYEEIKK